MLLNLTLMPGRWRSTMASITRLIPIISMLLLRALAWKARPLKRFLDKFPTPVLPSGIMAVVIIITIYFGKYYPHQAEENQQVILQKTLKLVLEVSLNSKKLF